jgi:hypothetical protein
MSTEKFSRFVESYYDVFLYAADDKHVRDSYGIGQYYYDYRFSDEYEIFFLRCSYNLFFFCYYY